MPRPIFIALLAVLLGATALFALPPPQHSARGTIHAIDAENRILVLEPGGTDRPAEFALVEKRTRLRRDGRPAALRDLTPGLPVQLYYKRENGCNVATEVNWKAAPIPPAEEKPAGRAASPPPEVRPRR